MTHNPNMKQNFKLSQIDARVVAVPFSFDVNLFCCVFIVLWLLVFVFNAICVQFSCFRSCCGHCIAAFKFFFAFFLIFFTFVATGHTTPGIIIIFVHTVRVVAACVHNYWALLLQQTHPRHTRCCSYIPPAALISDISSLFFLNFFFFVQNAHETNNVRAKTHT